MKTKISKICCIYILLLISIVYSTKQKEAELDKCNINTLDTLFDKYAPYPESPSSFDELYFEINKNCCSISKEDLKNKIIYLYQKSKRDSSDSPYSKENYLWLILLDDWNASVESLVKREMEYYKKNKDILYFRVINILLEFSENWFQYLEDMYYNMNSIDSGYEMKKGIYKFINKNYVNTKDKILTTKLESIYFALLHKEKYLKLLVFIDNLLCSYSETYKNSKQRKQFFIDTENKINNNIIKDAPEFYLNHSRNVLNYFQSLKKLTDYTPPLTYN